jgi:Spy/CpxP family protein refolding chaperone
MNKVVLALLIVSSFIMDATRVEAKPPPRHSVQVHDKLIELRGRLLKEMVGLDRSRASEVETILKGFDDEHRTYSAMLEQARKTMRRLVREDSSDHQALAKAVEDVRLAHDYLHQVRDKQYRAMQKALSPKEQALFFEFLGKLRHEVRKRLRHGPKESLR